MNTSQVKVTTPVGVAVLYLDSPNTLEHRFDCQSDEGSVSDLLWQRLDGINRFPTYPVGSQLRLDMAPENESQANSSDLGVYVCRNTLTRESMSLNITGGQFNKLKLNYYDEHSAMQVLLLSIQFNRFTGFIQVLMSPLAYMHLHSQISLQLTLYGRILEAEGSIPHSDLCYKTPV